MPPEVQERTRRRILAYAEKHYKGKYNRIEVRFRGALCYVDAYVEPVDDRPPPGESRQAYLERLRNTPLHMFRIRYNGDPELWAFAFYAYSSEKYERSVLCSGSFVGTPEEAMQTGGVYLQG